MCTDHGGAMLVGTESRVCGMIAASLHSSQHHSTRKFAFTGVVKVAKLTEASLAFVFASSQPLIAEFEAFCTLQLA